MTKEYTQVALSRAKVVWIHVCTFVLKDPQGEDTLSLIPLLVDSINLQTVGREGDITYWPFRVLNPNAERLPMARLN